MNGNLRFGALLRRSGILRRSAKSNGRVADHTSTIKTTRLLSATFHGGTAGQRFSLAALATIRRLSGNHASAYATTAARVQARCISDDRIAKGRRLVELGVFRLSLLENGDVWVGVFPK